MQIVRFTRRYERYNTGETAGFSKEAAADLLKRGVAVLANSDAGKATPPTQGHEAAAEAKRTARAEGKSRNRR